MQDFLSDVKEILSSAANANKAVPMKAYMKNQFAFLGIPMPVRRSIFKDYLKKNPIISSEKLMIIAKELWLLPEREYQYCAIDLLLVNHKLWNEASIQLFEELATTKSWWDTVDSLASDCMGKYFKKYPENMQKITKRWNQSDNMWLQRCSLLFQKNYKKDTDANVLAQYIQHLHASKEFFIQKAIGWILREYAKTNPAWVVQFVHTNSLANLSKREALKNIPSTD